MQQTQTANEQRLTNIEENIRKGSALYKNGIADLKTRFDSLKEKYDLLQTQAQSPQAHEVEDLSQEFAGVESAMAEMMAGADTIGGSIETPPIMPPVTGQISGPINHEPIEATPLAGESGPTNVPEDAQGNPVDLSETPLPVNQAQPGSAIENPNNVPATDPDLSASETADVPVSEQPTSPDAPAADPEPEANASDNSGLGETTDGSNEPNSGTVGDPNAQQIADTGSEQANGSELSEQDFMTPAVDDTAPSAAPSGSPEGQPGIEGVAGIQAETSDIPTQNDETQTV